MAPCKFAFEPFVHLLVSDSSVVKPHAWKHVVVLMIIMNHTILVHQLLWIICRCLSNHTRPFTVNSKANLTCTLEFLLPCLPLPSDLQLRMMYSFLKLSVHQRATVNANRICTGSKILMSTQLQCFKCF
uniref:Uncharacterized protein n=1 Tax=Panagrolaimus sp. JU765 TaxID=591449 RepID=A0AC34QFW3_9BILA